MKKVLLTGISGYIAMHCAKELLKRDYHINATVRNLDKVEDIKKALSALSLDVNKIQFFQADLLSDDNWEDAMADCEYVMHVASPYPLNQPKDEKDKKQNQQPQQPRQKELSPEQVKSLLEAMNNQEKEVQDKVNAEKAKGTPLRGTKDW